MFYIILKEGLVFISTCNSHFSIDPSLQSVSMARGTIPVLLPVVWSILCLLHLHKVYEISSEISEGEGNQTDHISGRPGVPVQFSEYPTQPNGIRQRFSSYAGSDHQQQIPNGTGPGDNASGSSSINISNVSDTTQTEDGMCPARGPTVAFYLWKVLCC